jgi:hypothetical protein
MDSGDKQQISQNGRQQIPCNACKWLISRQVMDVLLRSKNFGH